MKLLKHYILFLTFLLTSVMSKADVGTIATKSADTDGGITYYTYTRTGVSTNTWESFCLPMDIDINSLQTYFDIIYLAYDDEELEFYNDFDEASNAVKRRKTTSNASGITATAEAYSEESGYWTDDEEAAAATTRYCFAYSAEESSYYHYYIADFSSESSVIIPQGMPFFAHVKSDADLTNGLVITGHLNTKDTPQTGLVDKEFKVYKDLNLTSLDTDNEFHVIGSLSDGDTYSGTLYTISGTGTTTTASSLKQYRAYLTGTDATSILIYPKTRTELENIETPIDATDPTATLNLTDTDLTLTSGTYKAGNVTYTRTVTAGNYGTFCLPFDIKISDAKCFDHIYIPHNLSLYNPDNQHLRIFFKEITDITDFGDVIPAGQAFIAYMNGNISLSNASAVTYTNEQGPDIIESTINIYNWNEGTGGLTPRNKNLRFVYSGSYKKTTYSDYDDSNLKIMYIAGSGAYKELVSDGAVNPFRALFLLYTLSSTTQVKAIDCDFDFYDNATIIKSITNRVCTPNNSVYSIDGRLMKSNVEVEHELDGFHPGVYVINGKKVFKRN